ncbi:LLM class flavin-dependent oxidoreductase [Streptomyces sp. NBC_01214]|uniref:LLM class flavin-dependent oxidoreductase n=1 Tax=Streptomyces sp. NBC_01214 TaxID=2903777 RepID=UPI002254431B|nr:LLM class flavin-dependent oxidoreductase [Streptomyces sp. NBC_01214]MCX4808693.1 LLM class flavin-dependent oxidoreductase [Streptomyces sp. NBC_01214]
MRLHTALTAQAAATSSQLLDGGFAPGVGTGEALNKEAVEVIRALFTGRQVSHRGPHYTVENARLYTAPHGRLPIHVSGFRPQAACAAGYGALRPRRH